MAELEVIFGPPGTGKTTELSRLVRKHVERDGSDTLLLCAFTKTAAGEMAGRGMGLDSHQIGTIHSHCFQGLDRPPLAEAHYKEWNDTYPVYQLSPQGTIDDPGGPKLLGDEYLALCGLYRHRLEPLVRWPEPAQLFWKFWHAWKYDNGYCDYTDLIEKGIALMPIAPGHPRTVIVDEAQDLSLLQWQLLHQWGANADRFTGAGDDEQALYRWAGANFQPLLDAPARRVLPQSYRVPRAVQQAALRYSQCIHRRQAKTWQPRQEEGRVYHESGFWQHPDRWIARVQEWLEEPWGTYAFLAPCAYMLVPLIAALRQAGIPFSNRWRRKRRDWNPLTPPPKGIGMIQRIVDFCRPLERLWTWQELATWIPIIRQDGLLRHGAKAALTHKADTPGVCTMEDLQTIFQDDALQGALRGDTAWLEESVRQSDANALKYPLRVMRKYGHSALTDEPRVTVGNAHSVKGAEADTVVFFTELSRSQQLARCEGGDAADDVYRMLYVGATRAKETLYLVRGRFS